MFQTIYSQVGGVVTLLVVAFAFIKGGEPERIASSAFVLVTGAIMLVPGAHGGGAGPQWARMGLDILLLAVFIGLAWHSRRAWLIWASAFQSLIVTGHVMVVADLRPPGDAFAAVNNLSNYGLLVALAVGTFWAWQERRAAGLER